MAISSDLQQHLERLEAAGKLHHVRQRVDPSWEVAAITRHVFDRYGWAERPALCFDQVGDSPFPLVVGVVGGSPEIYARALGTTVNDIPLLWERAQEHPVDPELVASGPCKDVILTGEDVDVTVLPNAVWTPGQDPGPYITAPLIVTKDPESGRRNVGTYRLMVKGPRTLGIYIGPAQHGARHLQKYEALGQDMPVAIVIGADPAVVLSSVTKFSYATDEFTVAGGLRGEPVPLVRCESVDLEVPSTAEIVLEGVVRHGVRDAEGPFGEYTGYMGASGPGPVIEITTMTRREKPVYQAFLSQMPPSESSCIRSLGRASSLLRHLRDVIGFPVTDVHFPESGGANGIVIVALKKEYAEQVKEVAWATWSLMNKEGKMLIVVDDDIDIRIPFEVEWAMSFRSQPSRDLLIQDHVVAIGLDPSIVPVDVPLHDPRRRTGSKLLVDATRKHAYPAAARVPSRFLDRVKEQWSDYGF